VTCAPVRKTVFIYELLTSDQEIEGKTFEGLDIHGPGLVYVVPGKPFTCDGCIFHLPRGGSVESILWEVPPGTGFVGPIGLVDCTFRNCSFSGIGWVFSGYEADRFRQMVGGRRQPPNPAGLPDGQ
jgi:hypothetical protein